MKKISVLAVRTDYPSRPAARHELDEGTTLQQFVDMVATKSLPSRKTIISVSCNGEKYILDEMSRKILEDNDAVAFRVELKTIQYLGENEDQGKKINEIINTVNSLTKLFIDEMQKRR